MKDHRNSSQSGEGRCTRRTMLRGMAGAAAFGAVWPLAGASLAAELKGRIKQSVCLWCYNDYLRKAKMSLDQFAAACAKMGLKSIELTTPDQWPTLKKHGLICAMSIPEDHASDHRRRIHRLCRSGVYSLAARRAKKPRTGRGYLRRLNRMRFLSLSTTPKGTATIGGARNARGSIPGSEIDPRPIRLARGRMGLAGTASSWFLARAVARFRDFRGLREPSSTRLAAPSSRAC